MTVETNFRKPTDREQALFNRLLGRPCMACLQQHQKPCPSRVIGTPGPARRSFVEFDLRSILASRSDES